MSIYLTNGQTVCIMPLCKLPLSLIYKKYFSKTLTLSKMNVIITNAVTRLARKQIQLLKRGERCTLLNLSKKLNISRCSAVGSEQAKTVDNCFCDVISPKQRVEEASVSSDARRLCDGAFSPRGAR